MSVVGLRMRALEYRDPGCRQLVVSLCHASKMTTHLLSVLQAVDYFPNTRFEVFCLAREICRLFPYLKILRRAGMENMSRCRRLSLKYRRRLTECSLACSRLGCWDRCGSHRSPA